jgi:hypothetical protein
MYSSYFSSQSSSWCRWLWPKKNLLQQTQQKYLQ